MSSRVIRKAGHDDDDDQLAPPNLPSTPPQTPTTHTHPQPPTHPQTTLSLSLSLSPNLPPKHPESITNHLSIIIINNQAFLALIAKYRPDVLNLEEAVHQCGGEGRRMVELAFKVAR